MIRYVFKIKKTGNVKYISHLDTMRTMHRAIRRAQLPLTYSKGFNPHPSISFAAPLSLGFESLAEYADVEFDEKINSNEIKERLNKNLPYGMEVSEAILIDKKMPTSMAKAMAAKYEVTMKYSDIDKIKFKLDEIKNSKEILKLKKTKSGEKLINIREMIHEIDLKNYTDNKFTLECLLQASNTGSLNPDVVSDLFVEASAFGIPFIKRTEIYTLEDNKFIPLDKYFSRK